MHPQILAMIQQFAAIRANGTVLTGFEILLYEQACRYVQSVFRKLENENLAGDKDIWFGEDTDGFEPD